MKYHILMKYFGVLVFSILLFSSCSQERHYRFYPKNELSSILYLSLFRLDKYFLEIGIYNIGNYQISNFEYYDASIKIGNHEIIFERDDISITVYINEPSDIYGELNTNQLKHIIHSEDLGSVYFSNLDEPIEIKYINDLLLNQYRFTFTKYIDDINLKYIINEYENNNIYTTVNLNYSIEINGEKFKKQILEEFIFNAK